MQLERKKNLVNLQRDMYSSTVGFSSWKDGILRGKLYSTIHVSSMQDRRKV